MVSFAAPDDPGGSPNTVRKPNPSTAWMQLPASIMEGCPAPGIIRLPEPASIGVNPMASIAVRSPSVVDNHDARLPAPADAFKVDPRAVRRKVIVEVSDVRRRTADISRRGGFGCGWRRARRGGNRFWSGRGHRNWGDRRQASRRVQFLVITVARVLAPENIVPVQHGRDNGSGKSVVSKVQNLVGRKLKGRSRILDISPDELLTGSRAGQAQHLGGGR